MPAIFVAPSTLLSDAQLAGQRRRLAALLRDLSVEMKTVPLGDGVTLAERLIRNARGSVIIALDDKQPLPSKAAWLRKLSEATNELAPYRRPMVIYITHRTNAAGLSEVANHPLVRQYVTRDTKGRWVNQVAAMAAELCRELDARQVGPTAASGPAAIVGESGCFKQAVEELGHILRLPYGMVSGEPGVGKLYLIQALWRQNASEAPLIVLPCGSFFKDYYLAGSQRRIGGGREAVDQLTPFLDEADDGLLILDHVEQLPTALQEELAVRLSSSGRTPIPNPLCGVDSKGLVERNVKVIATSTYAPNLLEERGRLIPELARKLARRHVRVPTLRERGERDVQLVCEDLIRRIAIKQASVATVETIVYPMIAPEVMQNLRAAPWPGNVSDLVRVLEYAIRHCRGHLIQLRDLPRDMQTATPMRRRTLDLVTAEAQRSAIRDALMQGDGDIGKAAAFLGRNKHSLYRLMRSLGISAGRADT